MPYVIGSPCIDVMDRSCIEECPVDCIYEGQRKLYINPIECIDCGACEPVCPVEAISQDRRVSDEDAEFVEDNRRFFTVVLTGRDEAIGSPGGANQIGPVGVDTALVAQRRQPPS
ncbi:ferredoxin [Mycolicibacterium elephantis]|uniref:Ferredoxin n=1 Tax=Mycolicibacterium elephantis TaxID=81858 RepID=A0A0M2ZMW5_9MYCO|nr:ferredoxin [Mycolicibacterium elephantis]KKW65173.1 (4Fe-4S)-binding protein [Mycolicibacterium elephantis]OBA67055.1 (4Fe-4S)-binding protein [Mycolicibacterium elephantis]OBB26710.1 (4Fe-4S)-binding protein [Mycolicibacterium elephantis]ORA62781.1 (4Fe-4S)-binding protein [Mycolicibacterium elephantis]